MSEDFDFNNAPQSQNINFKDLYFNPKQGTSLVRIVDLRAKTCKSHYVPDATGKKRFVKSPGAGDPLIVDGNNPRTRYFLKVIDRESGTLKVWEFGSQIKGQIEEFVTDLAAKRKRKETDESDVLTNYNIEIRKRAPGSNPLYMLSIRERIKEDNERDKATLENDQRVIDTTEINMENVVKPWSIERIKKEIYGIDVEGGGTTSAQVQPVQQAPVQQAPVQASAPSPAQPVQQAPAQQPAVAATATATAPASSGPPEASGDADANWLDD